MRHRKKFRRLSRFGSSRKALFRNMAIDLLKYERIITTLAKAKEMRSVMDELINFGKKNDLNARRSAFRLLQDRKLVEHLFKEIAPRFKDVNSGYTRIIRYNWRKGDGAPLAILEFTIQKPEEKRKEVKKKGAKEVTPEKKEEIKEKEILPEEKIVPPVPEKEEKPTPPKEKPKRFLDGIRSLFRRSKKERKEE